MKHSTYAAILAAIYSASVAPRGVRVFAMYFFLVLFVVTFWSERKDKAGDL